MVDERERRLRVGWRMRDPHPTTSQQQTGCSISIAQHASRGVRGGARVCVMARGEEASASIQSIQIANGPSRPLQVADERLDLDPASSVSTVL